ncbi:fimbrial biogenesis outer membrane usher protein [Pseudomonas sp. NFXW11]|uniref:fimbria/pilus outer membrane usher protein n=1 Tax=Pseudomonas sp. NFXW11 TaxID=2819531 RepID=UPI003CF84391
MPALAQHITEGDSSVAPEQPVFFDTQMLFKGDGTSIDTQRFERPGYITPGRYLLDLRVSGQWRGLVEMELRESDDPQGSQPCYDRELLQQLGIDLQKADAALGEGSHPLQGTERFCGELGSYIRGVTSKVDMAQQQLELSVPQYFLVPDALTTYIDPANWDPGINAARLNYSSNLFSSQSRGQRRTNGYAGLNMGLNAGALRLRHSGALTWSPENGSDYQRGYIYGQTDLTDWRSQLLVGESVTESDLFDSVSFRGVKLFSDDRMLPMSQRHFAPVVRGTANTNAKVSIYQRDYLVYETTVAPGPFEIADLQAASFGGDLQVTVSEADGQRRSFTVPFATMVRQLRPGQSRYSLTAGQVTHAAGRGLHQYVLQGTLQRGLDSRFTGYVGSSLTGSYMSGLIGAALNTELGGFGLDLTQASTRVPQHASQQGSSLRLSYSKHLHDSGTQFSLLAYRYSTSGYLGLSDAIALEDRVRHGGSYQSFARVRNRLDANINQRLGEGGGSFFLTGSSLNYWNRSGRAQSYTLGYSDQLWGSSYSLSAQRLRGSSGLSSGRDNRENTLYSFSLSIPLGAQSRRATQLNAYINHDQQTGAHYSTGLSGSVGERGDLSYGLSVAHDAQPGDTSGNANLSYYLPQVSLSSSYSQGRDYRSQSLGASGGMLLHSGGLTLSQTLSETAALVHAPHAEGAGVGYSGGRVDRAGYAVLPSLTPYQLNTVDLDPSGIDDDVEVQVSSRNVAPRAGAVVRLSYPTRRARALLIDSRQVDGQPLPFAALALDAQSAEELGAVGQGSRLVLRSEKDQGQIRVEWGREPGEQCLIDYVLPPRKAAPDAGHVLLDLPCRALPQSDAPSHPESSS